MRNTATNSKRAIRTASAIPHLQSACCARIQIYTGAAGRRCLHNITWQVALARVRSRQILWKLRFPAASAKGVTAMGFLAALRKSSSSSSRFDDMSRAVAGGLSRRQALGIMGGTMGGAVVGSLGMTVAAAPKAFGAPSSCSVLCGKTSFTSGPAHAACLQACRECQGDITRLCQSPTGTVCCAPGSSCCFGPTGAFCCPSGTFCAGGQCLTPRSFCVPTCADTCTGSGTSCSQNCASGTPGCSCVSTTEGSACVQQVCTFVTCTSSADCGPGSVCFTQGCCGP